MLLSYGWIWKIGIFYVSGDGLWCLILLLLFVIIAGQKVDRQRGSRTINYVTKWGVKVSQMGSGGIYSGSLYQVS